MRIGTAICAAREGKVVRVRFDSYKGGLNWKYFNDGNHIVIEHSDGSVALYWHLKQNGVTVTLGDIVQKGQLIGYSGNTGYTAFPHLHFQLLDKNRKEILPRFHTHKGICYLKRWQKYKRMV